MATTATAPSTSTQRLNQHVILRVRCSPRSSAFRKRYMQNPWVYGIVYWLAQSLTIGNIGVENELGNVFNEKTSSIQREHLSDVEIQRSWRGKIFGYGDQRIQSTGGDTQSEVINPGYQRPSLVKKLVFALRRGEMDWKPGVIYTIREKLSLILIPTFYSRAINIVFLLLGILLGGLSSIIGQESLGVVIYTALRGLLIADLVILAGLALGWLVPN